MCGCIFTSIKKILKVRLFHWKWLTGKCFPDFRVFVSRKISDQRKIFSWSTENQAILRKKKILFFFPRKIFFRKSFFGKHFPVSRFTRTKRSLNCKLWKILGFKLQYEKFWVETQILYNFLPWLRIRLFYRFWHIKLVIQIGLIFFYNKKICQVLKSPSSTF